MNALMLRPEYPFINQILHTDLFTLCKSLPNQSVDMILCDLPYGTTALTEWDNVIPFGDMWKAFKRVIKSGGVIALTGSDPFAYQLKASNPKWYRYEIIAEKDNATGFLNANRQPLKAHETVMVFYERLGTYNPQFEQGKAYRATSGAAGGHIHDKSIGGYETINNGKRFPRSVQRFNFPSNPIHPTQKPVDLFAWLIRTYTHEGEIVLDPCVGSGTTALAALKTGRHYVCGDLTERYVKQSRARIADCDPFQATIINEGIKQHSLFEVITK